MWKRLGCNIGIPVSRNFKRAFTNKLLDWAERLPAAKPHGLALLLYQLQATRQSQRRLAETSYERTRPPAGTEIKLIGIQLFEIFHYEEFDRLLSGLLSLFPNVETSQINESFTSYFKSLSENITGGGWCPVGDITASNGHYPGAGRRRRMPKLDPRIRSIRVSIQKQLPSIMIVRFDVDLTDRATQELIEIQAQRHLPLAALESININPTLLGVSQTFLNNGEKALEYLAEIRRHVEETIKRFLCGHFMALASEPCRLPAIEYYSIAGTGSNSSDFVAWAEKGHGWSSSLGFDFYRGAVFGNDKMVFNWRGFRREQLFFAADRIIILAERFLDPDEVRAPNTDSAAVAWMHLIDSSEDYVVPFVFIQFLYSSMQILERIRRKVFDTIKERRGNARNISRYVGLYEQFQQLARVLRRFDLEYRQEARFLEGLLRESGDLPELAFSPPHRVPGPNDTLSNAVSNSVKYWKQLLLGQVDFIEKAFSAHIEFFNIDAIYRLQRVTTWLTVVATFAALIGLVLTIQPLASSSPQLAAIIRQLTAILRFGH